VALANAGGDIINTVKQGQRVRHPQGGQTLTGLLLNINDIHALTLPVA
jgi:branched-chain amino acid transport system substrate-binding protein